MLFRSKKTTKVAASSFAPNKPCTKLNAHAPRSTYDCVRVGNGLLWQSRGTVNNPYAIGEPGSSGQPNPWRTYSVGVIERIAPLDPAALGAVNGAKKPIPPGETPATFRLGVTNWSGYMGDLGEPGVAFELVDGAGTVYPLIGDRSCEAYGDVSGLALIPIRRLTIMDSVGLMCVVIPSAALTDSLRLRIGTEASFGRGIIYIYWRVT